jgi:hypothetical protein
MEPASDIPYIAFDGDRCIASGDLRIVARAAKDALDRRKDAAVLVFNSSSGPVEIDFRGSVGDVLARLPDPDGSAATEDTASPAPRGPGRPKLGVVAREVTLLPRHWEWLGAQPGGASVALRKLADAARATRAGADRRRLAQQSGGASVALRRLVDEARRANKDKDRVRQAREAAYRFIAAMGENKPHYEEVARALFAGDAGRFEAWTKAWPPDIRDHARRLAATAFEQPAAPAVAG